MQAIANASYLTAACAFLAGTLLLAVGWHGRRTGLLLVVATLVTAAWGGVLAYAGWRNDLGIGALLGAEALRYGAWLVFLSAVLRTAGGSRLLRSTRIVANVCWIALALYCLWPATRLPTPLPFMSGMGFAGVLVLAMLGAVLLEQIFRNADPERHWALKYLMIGLGVMFAYDVFLYSYAVLYRELNASIWAARGFVDALTVPLVVVAAARNREWKLDVAVSRRAVFYSGSLLLIAAYILATAIGGYYVRLYGGDWGRVTEITLACFAALAIAVLAGSGQARARFRVFLNKNFFSYRHDYREEWLRLTATLAAGDRGVELPQRAVRALAQTMDSPAGALFLHDDAGGFVLASAVNLTLPADLRLDASEPAFECMRTRKWIYELDASAPSGAAPPAPAALRGIPRGWLLVPLVLEDRLLGFVLLAASRARRALDWEDIDLLRTAGSQVTFTLAQAAGARRLAEARQFEGFNRLTAFLMHDLKNVAAQQSLLLQNAERHKRNPAFVDDMLATVENSVQRITRLLEQLRGGSAPAAGKRVQVEAVVARALAECRAQQPTPVLPVGSDAAWVRADPEQFATVIAHLVRNAQDAATPAGHVALRLQHDARDAVIEIRDDGCGMDAAFIREHLFQPFFTTKASKGMGIGAYQAREYIRSLGGSLGVESEPGHGSTFTIRVPLAASVGAEPAPGDRLKEAS